MTTTRNKNLVFRTLKTSLHSVIKDPDKNLPKINDIVLVINKLRCHMLQFSKLYLLYLYQQKLPFPNIDREYFQCIIRTLTFSKNKRKPFTKSLDMFQSINSFYESHYKQLIYTLNADRVCEQGTNENDIIIDGYRDIVRYMITDVITDYENNIKMRFYNHVKNYVYSIFNKDLYINMVRKLESSKQNRNKLISMKMKVINRTIKNIYEQIKHPVWLDLPNILPKCTSLAYNVACNPQDYIKTMIFTNLACENNDTKTLNVFPLKRSIVPGHIRLDTKTIIEQFITNKKIYRSTGDIEMFKDVIWDEIFKIDKKIFNDKKFKFNGSIQTDGFSISILQSHKKEPLKVKLKELAKEMYIDDVKIKELKNKTAICIDPNKDDLIFCGKGIGENFTTFRYTNNQRSKETCKRKYMHILRNEKKLNEFVQEKETELSNFSSKTININKFKEYIKKKNEINVELSSFYENILWRKQRLSVFVKTKQSEMKMLNRFKKKLGSPEEAFIGFGDWSQKEQMKYKEPTKGKSFRDLFRKAGYKVYLIDEYRTSKCCCNCKNKDAFCERFLKVKSPRPWKKDIEITCNGLVKCTTCNTMFNRDVNSVINMIEIVNNQIINGCRPNYLNR